MKLNFRDKVILLIFIFIVICIIGFVSFVKPQIETIQASTAALATKQAELKTVEERVASLPDVKKSVKDKYKEIKERVEKEFLPEMETYELDKYIQPIIEENKLIYKGMDTQLAEASALEYYTYDYRDLQYDINTAANLNGVTPKRTSITVSTTPEMVPTTTLAFEMGFDEVEQIFAFCDSVKKFNKSCYVSAIGDGEKDEETNELKGTVAVTFYGVEPVTEPKD